MGEYAKRAVAAGNDDEARQFLSKKAELTGRLEVLQKQYDLCADSAEKMRAMHDKLQTDIVSLKNKRDTLKAKAKVAETQKKMNKMGSGLESAGSNLAAFDRMEDKVNKMLDEADAMAELNAPKKDSIEELAKKYESTSADSLVDDELAALKAEMGM